MNEQPDPNGHAEERRKAEVHAEEVKGRHTSHWDMDYMTREEMDAVYREQQDEGSESDQSSTED